jgi:starch synthase
VDTQLWNPARDPSIAHGYVSGNSVGKEQDKQALCAEFRLEHAPQRMLIAVVGRLTAQKGVDLLLQAFSEAPLRELQLIVLGSGEAMLERAFTALAAARPGMVAAHIGFDEGIAHRVFAGADAIAVPSRFEPCGLTQLYGLRYGTVPIVRRVGGLADTVRDESTGPTATGFVFEEATAAALAAALVRAQTAFADRERWQALRRNGMREDVSWEKPAQAYRGLYEQLRGASGVR